MIFLKKHYFDAIAPDGAVVIVYDAILRLSGLPWVFRYSSRLSSPASGEMNLVHSATSAVISGVALADPHEVADVGSKIRMGQSNGFAATWRVLQPGWRQHILLDDRTVAVRRPCFGRYGGDVPPPRRGLIWPGLAELGRFSDRCEHQHAMDNRAQRRLAMERLEVFTSRAAK